VGEIAAEMNAVSKYQTRSVCRINTDPTSGEKSKTLANGVQNYEILTIASRHLGEGLHSAPNSKV
jgi:hypothetical protein